MRPKTITFSMDGADVDGICVAQAIAGAGAALLNGSLVSGGVATLDVARHVLVDSANAGDTTQTATITGTDRNGNTITEAIALNGTTAVAGTKNFKTVTAVSLSAAMAGNFTLGTTTSADTGWFPWDRRIGTCHIQVQHSGTVTYGADHTMTDVQSDGFLEDDADLFVDGTMTGETSTTEVTRIGDVPRASRIAITGYNASAELVITYSQPG